MRAAGESSVKRNPFSISEGAEARLRKAIEAQVRQRHAADLLAAKDKSAKAAIEDGIRREIKEQMKQVCSPHSFWGSQQS